LNGVIAFVPAPKQNGGSDASVAFSLLGLGTLDHDAIKWNRIMISSPCLSMTFSENRFPLFRIML
jgi:hypothetical protein